MKIYVLLKQGQGHEGSKTICVSEDINKIRTSICEDFDANEDYPGQDIQHCFSISVRDIS